MAKYQSEFGSLKNDAEAAWEAGNKNVYSSSWNENSYLLAKTDGLGSDKDTKMSAQEDATYKMSSLGFVANIIAGIFPMGFLPLSLGFRDSGIGHILIFTLAVYGGALYTMWAIGSTCQMTGLHSFAEQWENLIGKRTVWIPLLSMALATYGCAVLTLHFAVDMFEDVHKIKYEICMSWASFVIVMPLSFIKDMATLSFPSCVSMVFIVYVVGLIVCRGLDGTYGKGGMYYNSIESQERHPLKIVNQEFLDVLGMMQVSFFISYNGPKYWRELKEPTPASYTKNTAVGLTVSLVLYAVTAYFGWHTFQTHTPTGILGGYSSKDTCAQVARIFLPFLLLMAIPFLFQGLREAITDYVNTFFPTISPTFGRVRFQQALSVGMTLATFVLALFLRDLAALDCIVVAVFGCACIYVIPLILHEAALRSTQQLTVGALMRSWAVLFGGVCAGITGVVIYVLSGEH